MLGLTLEWEKSMEKRPGKNTLTELIYSRITFKEGSGRVV
jgi:hypothetical protein